MTILKGPLIICTVRRAMILIRLVTLRAIRVFLFFFQAEDGIRDLTVTGVQTCALPISYAPGLEARFEAEIEIGRVDADEEIGRIAQELRAERAADREDRGHALQHLDVAAHRELFHGKERASAFRDHLRSRDAMELRVLPARLHRAHESRAQHVARGLARDDRDPRHLRIPRVEAARKSTMARTCGASTACFSSSAWASAMARPDL